MGTAYDDALKANKAPNHSAHFNGRREFGLAKPAASGKIQANQS
jgi:hypothetical protein